VSVAQNIKA